MTKQDQGETTGQKTRERVRAAVERGDRIREDVRTIVVEALGEHHLDKGNIERTVAAVMEGAIEGAPEGSRELADTMKKTIKGLDEALAKAAEASKLAIEEAVGRAEEFSEQDLKRALDDLNGLEELFLETLGDLAKAGQATAGSVLDDLVKHAERTGTQIGKSVARALRDLQGALSRAERPHLSDMEKAARTGAASVASIASGILAGLADNLAPSERDAEDKPEKKDG